MSDKSRYSAPAALGIEHTTYLRWLRRYTAAHPTPSPLVLIPRPASSL